MKNKNQVKFEQLLKHEGLSLDHTRPLSECQNDADAMRVLADQYPAHSARLCREARQMMDACRLFWTAVLEAQDE